MAEIEKVSDHPLVFSISLSEGVTEGRREAAEDFVEGLRDLQKLHPTKRFQHLPFQYKTVNGEDPALTSILSIEI
ncbi:MAG: hypothetical protein NTV48_02515 [Candidatus Vogelbacteria bacterium]|nr:hypothetical protein [Candidatus Vogelbacteria bacterium]